MLAVSSIYRGSVLRKPALVASFTQSFPFILPFLRVFESTRASVESILVASCSFDISRLKVTTSFSARLATFVAIFIANEVFPIPGRAAMIIRSDLLRPDVMESSKVKPVLAPTYFSLSGPDIFPSRSYASAMASERGTRPRTSRPCLISYIFCSAESRRSCAFCSPD